MPLKKKPLVVLGIFWMLLVLSACKNEQEKKLFTALPSSVSGITFNNEVKDTDSSYSFINEFGYMGGGVGIGDFNNDGLKDIYFTGNQVSSRLYINKGNNSFEDITDKAGVGTKTWATGISIADINNDGYDDIYVCVFGKNLKERSPNLLFINQHDLTFKESAAEYGLADNGFSTQAAFFDYDKDGDLDMYLANYLLSNRNGNTIYQRDRSGFSDANDKLYRNDGDSLQKGHPHFTDVTQQAGIKEDGYGLGLSISDLNTDGWPDIYVANDFLSNDNLWLNNKNGTFTNSISRSLQHQSYSSMGSDAADINNDQLPDLVTLDMLPADNYRKKTSFSFMNYDRYQAERSNGYEPEFMRNMLQLNNGTYQSGDTSLPFFSEIGQLGGIHQTDWSWSVLLADYNNDGWKDMHITNGVGRDFINADFLEFSNEIFNSAQSREEQEKIVRKKISALDHVNLPNYLYINQQGVQFADSSAVSGINDAAMSNGAAYADLDNDGDLDLVINNIHKEAFIFINNSIEPTQPITAHYLKIDLKGADLNKKGIGTKVFVYTKEGVQTQEQNPVRGYFSSVDQQLLFGLGNITKVDSVVVIWPDNKKQSITGIAADTLLTINYTNASTLHDYTISSTTTLFADISGTDGLMYRHIENEFNDFAFQPLLPHKFSQLGPFITTGDVNNDGETDFFIGGGFSYSGKIFTQRKGSSFNSTTITDSVKINEDMDCVFFDADKDGDQDLLVSIADIQYEPNSKLYTPRLYLNDGKGNFVISQQAIPATVKVIGAAVCATDYDMDGDIDLFIGGRVSNRYPESPQSYILQNNNAVFTDVTEKLCPELKKAGMVTAAVWTDINNDKIPDLIIAGEWMPIRFFTNQRNKFIETTAQTGLTAMEGMWRSLVATDIDNDGDQDLVAGNLGLNCEYAVSTDAPMQVYAGDVDGNGTIDPVPFYYIKGKDDNRHSYPSISRGMFASQVPSIKKRFLLNSEYAIAGFDEVFKGKTKKDFLELSCTETRSCYFENVGNGKFIKHVLPIEAQFAPINAIIADDLDNDGYTDLIVAGNEYQMDVMTGRFDASFGLYLKGTKGKTFLPVRSSKSGLLLRGDVKDLAVIKKTSGEKILLAAVNNDSLRVFRVNK